MPAIKVLIVDDSRDLREAYEAVLTVLGGCEVVCAAGVDEALETARRWRPDVILSDISMPGKSGFDLITQVRSDLRPPLPAIGIISGFPDFEAEALRRGAAAFALKPLDPASLRAFVDCLRRAEGPPPPLLRERALRERCAATHAAEETLRRTLDAQPHFVERVNRGASVLSRYFGGATVLVVLLQQGALRVVACSDPDYVADPTVVGLLGYATEVIESGASLVIPDVQTWAALQRVQGAGVGMLISTPFHAPDGVPIGSLTIIAKNGVRLDATDLAIAEHAAQRGSDLLAGSPASGLMAGLWLFDRQTWRRLLRLELGRLRNGAAVGVALLEPENTDAAEPCGERWLETLSARMALGELQPGTWGLFKLASNAGEAREALTATAKVIAGTLGLRRGAVLTFAGIDAPERSETLLDLAAALFETAARKPRGTLLHAVVQPEPSAVREGPAPAH